MYILKNQTNIQWLLYWWWMDILFCIDLLSYIYIYKWHSIIILSVINVGFISYRFVVMTISSFINNYLHVNYFKIPAFSVYGKHYFKMINEKYDIVYVFTRIFVKVFYHVHSRYVEVLRYRHLIHLQRIHRLLVIKH